MRCRIGSVPSQHGDCAMYFLLNPFNPYNPMVTAFVVFLAGTMRILNMGLWSILGGFIIVFLFLPIAHMYIVLASSRQPQHLTCWMSHLALIGLSGFFFDGGERIQESGFTALRRFLFETSIAYDPDQHRIYYIISLIILMLGWILMILGPRGAPSDPSSSVDSIGTNGT